MRMQSLEYSLTDKLLTEHNLEFLSKKGGKDQQLIQSSTIPDPGYNMGK